MAGPIRGDSTAGEPGEHHVFVSCKRTAGSGERVTGRQRSGQHSGHGLDGVGPANCPGGRLDMTKCLTGSNQVYWRPRLISCQGQLA